MSNSSATAQALAGNRQFWQGIGKLPVPAQQSFWAAGTALSLSIGENPSPRTLTFDTSQPPADASWWEKLLFYAGQSKLNEAAAHAAVGTVVGEKLEWLGGALMGDFNKSPTTGQVITGGIISMIPVADQVCDARDLIANCLDLNDEEARKDPAKWAALGMTCVGFVPEFGSAVKTVAKVGVRQGTPLLSLLKDMEWIEKNFQTLKIACPWGYAPIEWLRKYDWVGQLKQAGLKAQKAFQNGLQKAEVALKYAAGVVQTKLQQLVDLLKPIIAKIVSVMEELGRTLKDNILQMTSAGKKDVGKYDATPGAGVNKHAQRDIPPPPRGPNKPPRMAPHKPKCFKPGDGLKKSWKDDPKKLEKEFYEQLKAQEKGINELSVGEYLENRARYAEVQRAGTGAAQEEARNKLSNKIYKSVKTTLERQGIVGAEGKNLAIQKTADVMSTLAALHDPDMIAGGHDKIRALGDRNVNSSIGSQWPKEGRLKTMDDKAEEARKNYGPDAKMNVTLERCK